MKKQKGQAFVELALTLPIILLLLLGALDLFLFGVNTALAKSYTHIAVREASVYMQGDTISCIDRVDSALPDIAFISGVNLYSFTISPCSGDVGWEVPEGENVVSRMEFIYDPFFLPIGTLRGFAETNAVFERTGFSQ